jgi:hypothetical protein
MENKVLAPGKSDYERIDNKFTEKSIKKNIQ